MKFFWDLGGRNPLVFFVRIANELQNRSKSWDVSIRDSSTDGSLSNTPSYISVCQAALVSTEYFAKFRSCKSYRKILEHVPPRTGEKYLQQLDKTGLPFKTLHNLIPKINVGGPASYYFIGLGRVSPTSIRYAKVHNDLRNLFGTLDDFTILEIGCGYGGLALQLIQAESLFAFDIADLEVVEHLALKYVSTINPDYKRTLRLARNQNYKSIDLLVSNYAFSELSRELQDSYLERYILKAKKGYMIYNHINPESYNSYTAVDILGMIPGSELMQEVPLTDSTNVLIVWGHKLE